MATRKEKVRVGVFLLGALALLATTVAALRGFSVRRDKLRYEVRFSESVSGLEVSSPVKYLGVKVGQLKEFHLEEGDVVVVLEVRGDTPVVPSTRAEIVSQGITGLRYIELSKGDLKEERLPADSRIQSNPSLTGKLEVAFVDVQKAVSDIRAVLSPENRANLAKLLESTNRLVATSADKVEGVTVGFQGSASELQKTAAALTLLVEENRAEVKKTVATLEETVARVDRIVAEIEERKVVATVDETARAARDAARGTAAAVARADRTLEENRADLRDAVEALARASKTLDDLARELWERPSAILRDAPRREREIPD